ncbi:MAG: DNA cytosine methyltransferase, partial [Candidatus Paceibacterota bacterium]
PSSTVGASPNTGNGRCPASLAVVDISRYAIGDEWDKLKPGEQSGKYNQLVRCSPDQPTPTIVAGNGTDAIKSAWGPTHPYEKRKFTIAELKRICGFPDDFILTGTFAQQWERLGRAVAPPMMAAVAAHIRDTILQPARVQDVT